MSLTLIIGPVKSAKSLELISLTAPHEFAGQKVLLVHPVKNVREKHITSRLGVSKTSRKVEKLSDIKEDFDVIGIDEIHMFGGTDTRNIKKWLLDGKEIIISGLDLDYKGQLMPIIRAILELKPDKVIYKRSVCEICKSFEGAYTQILQNGKIIKRGLPSVVPESSQEPDRTYRPVCRACFFAA